MNIAAGLSELTQVPETCVRIPAFLSAALAVEAVSLTVIREAPDDSEPHVLFSGASVDLADAAFRQAVVDIHSELKSRRVTVESREDEGAYASFPMESGGFARALVFDRPVDLCHRMLLIVHERVEEPGLSGATADSLNLIAMELVKQLRILITWQNSPDALGAPFSALTDREWVVLRSLHSEVGEKQLADKLGLSPHTLHSHIKSIYRKVGVPGRLPLLLRLRAALTGMRLGLEGVAVENREHRERVNVVEVPTARAS